MLTTPPRKDKECRSSCGRLPEEIILLPRLFSSMVMKKNNETKCYEPLHDPSAPNALVLVTAEEARKMCPNVPCVAVVMDPNIARECESTKRKAFDGCFGRCMG